MTAVCAERLLPSVLHHLREDDNSPTFITSASDLHCRICRFTKSPNSKNNSNNRVKTHTSNTSIAPTIHRMHPKHTPMAPPSTDPLGGSAVTPASAGGRLLPVWRESSAWRRWCLGRTMWTVLGASLVICLLNVSPGDALPAAQPLTNYNNGYYDNHYDNYGNNGNHGNHRSMAGDEEYDEPEVFRLRGRPVTDTAYLTTFGYLPQSDFETGAMRTEEEMSRAIRRFQQFANLPLSGTFDEKTRSQMAKPRCGLPDIIPTQREPSSRRRSRANNQQMEVISSHRLRHKHGHGRVKRYELSEAKWENTQLTFRILNHTPDLEQKDIRRAIYRALKLWSDVTHLNFREKLGGDADIMIRFAAGYHGDGYSFDGPGLILAHAFFPGPDRGGDVHFDEDEHWTAGTTEGTNLFIVAAHEIGHALGLSHSPVPGSLMFPWYQGYMPNYQLPQDDVDGIQAFYGVKTRPVVSTLPPVPGGGGNPGGGHIPTSLPPAPTTTFQPITRQAWTTTTPLPTPPTGSTPPDSCNAVIDAISIVRGEIFAFSGKWFWRVDGDGVMKDYPVQIDRFWYGFPKEVDRIDAVYEQFGGKIIFFRGQRYWTFNSNRMVPNFPKEGRPLTDLGLPADLTHVDAAFQWGYNKMVYIISGFNYWRFNVHENKVEADYPRDMSMWQGVPLPVGAAFQFWDGRTYFFQGTQTWCFNDARMAVREAWPKHTGETFLDCKRQMKQGFEAENPGMSTGGSPQQHHLTNLLTHLLITIVSFVIVLVLAS